MNVTKYNDLVQTILRTSKFDICEVTTSRVVDSNVVTLTFYVQVGSDVYVINLDLVANDLELAILSGSWVVYYLEGYNFFEDDVKDELNWEQPYREETIHRISVEEYGSETVRNLAELLRVV